MLDPLSVRSAARPSRRCASRGEAGHHEGRPVTTAPADIASVTIPLTVAIDVSALRRGPPDDAAFVRFVLDACERDAGVVPSAWLARWSGVPREVELTRASRVRAALTGPLGAVRMPGSARWVAPNSQVVYLASGQGPLRATPPAVVTVQRFEPHVQRGPAEKRQLELLRGAADRGVVVHAPTHALGHALVEHSGLDRASIVIVAPGVEIPTAESADAPGSPRVDIVGGRSTRRDHEVAAAITSSGVLSYVVPSVDGQCPPRCVVVATPEVGFPYQAMRALALGIPVVAARTETTTELLEGAATLVDPLATEEFVAAALELVGDDSARSVTVTAGLARASDYSWERRAGEIVQLLRRSCASQ
jgi:glycosyltransferase involved in cell wall biosynthesis